MNINFKTEKQKLKRVDANLVAENSQNFLYAVFNFDEIWNGFSKKAVFEHRGNSYSRMLTDDRCAVPYEVISADGFNVSLIGVDDDGNVRITSSRVRVPVEKGPKLNTRNASEPTPTEIEQLTAIVNSVKEETDGIKEKIDEYLTENSPAAKETDPTVPDWAKQSEKPVYTADEVGARPKDWLPTLAQLGGISEIKVGTLLAAHNNSESAHNDLRQFITDLSAGKLDASMLTEAVNTALAEAKASGEFDGEKGDTGPQGPQGATGAQGPAYTLTEADRSAIASAVKASLTTETWTFTLEDGSTVTKNVVVK